MKPKPGVCSDDFRLSSESLPLSESLPCHHSVHLRSLAHCCRGVVRDACKLCGGFGQSSYGYVDGGRTADRSVPSRDANLENVIVKPSGRGRGSPQPRQYARSESERREPLEAPRLGKPAP